jgi:hypothetical protein
MDLFEKKIKADPEIRHFIKNLKYKNYPVKVKGSNNYTRQYYFSDYDLLSVIPLDSAENVYKVIRRIIDKCDKDKDMYFIEMKIEKLNGDKYKFLLQEDINEKDFISNFDDINFIKLDYVVRVEYNFFEMSIIYKFYKEGEDPFPQDFVDKMIVDIKELSKEGNYYKVLKKIFSINSYYDSKNRPVDKKVVGEILKLINSDEYGGLYQKKGILEANKRLLTNYDDENTIKKVIINLKALKLQPDLKVINKEIKRIDKIINSRAKEIFDNIKNLYK